MKIAAFYSKTKSDPNIHQNAPNYIILKKILGGHAPDLLAKLRDMQISKSEKNILLPPPPPLPNPGNAPVTT